MECIGLLKIHCLKYPRTLNLAIQHGAGFTQEGNRRPAIYGMEPV